MKDQISALLDGEMEPAEAGRLIGRIETEPDLRRTWDDYHRVGDALRGHVGRDFSASVAARLAAEPTVLCRHAGFPVVRHAGRWALSMAAGLAAVALVAWMALPGRAPAPQIAQVAPPADKPFGSVPAPLAAGPQVASVPRTVAARVQARNAAQAEARAHAEALAALGMRNYLLAHQRFSPSSAMQGVAPYARTVASEGGER